MQLQNLVEDLDYLNNPISNRIIHYLKNLKNNKGVNELSYDLRIAQPVLSKMLMKMWKYGLVNREREGKNVYYSVNEEKLVEFNLKIKKLAELHSPVKVVH